MNRRKKRKGGTQGTPSTPVVPPGGQFFDTEVGKRHEKWDLQQEMIGICNYWACILVQKRKPHKHYWRSLPMHKSAKLPAWLILVVAAILFILDPVDSPAATTHIIQFGGSVGLAYSPGSLSVAVGDTIQWQGDFGFHPLSSTTIPAGAGSWHNATGTVFNYVVSLPGTYNYHCDVHFGLGMVGSFNAIAAGVDEKQISGLPGSVRLDQNYPNPFNPMTKIQFTIVNRQLTIVKVYDLLGSEVATLVNEVKQPGTYTVVFDGSNLESGVYFYRLQAGSDVETKRLILVK
jgi:plastocyanin